MRVKVTFVSEGKEAPYSLDFDLPVLPTKGADVLLSRPGQGGEEKFTVHRVWWQLSHPSTATDDLGEVVIRVECQKDLWGTSNLKLVPC